MDSGFRPSNNSFMLSKSRVSKINKLCDIQKQKDKQQINNTQNDYVVSNSSTSVVTLDSPTLDDMNKMHALPNRGRSNTYFDANMKLQQLFSSTNNKTAISPTKRFNSGLGSPDYSDDAPLDEVEDDEERVDLNPKLRSRSSIIRLSRENTPYKRPNKTLELGGMKQNSNSLSVKRFDKKRNKKIELRSQLGQPVPLDYIPSSVPNNGSLTSYGPELETKLKRIIQRDKSLFESRLQQIRRHFDSDSQKNIESLPTPKSTISGINTTTNKNVFNEPHTDEFRKELTEQAEKLNEVLQLLRSKSETSNRIEASLWMACIIILLLCNVYVYYYL